MQSFYKGDIEIFACYSGKKVPYPCKPKRSNLFHLKKLIGKEVIAIQTMDQRNLWEIVSIASFPSIKLQIENENKMQ